MPSVAVFAVAEGWRSISSYGMKKRMQNPQLDNGMLLSSAFAVSPANLRPLSMLLFSMLSLYAAASPTEPGRPLGR